jgi:hypothetical protein
VFSAREHPIGQLSVDRLIVHHALVFLFYPDSDSLCSCSWLRTDCWQNLARKNTVRNRDTGSGLIETSQDIYNVQGSENNYKKFKTKVNRQSSKAPHP